MHNECVRVSAVLMLPYDFSLLTRLSVGLSRLLPSLPAGLNVPLAEIWPNGFLPEGGKRLLLLLRLASVRVRRKRCELDALVQARWPATLLAVWSKAGLINQCMLLTIVASTCAFFETSESATANEHDVSMNQQG